LYIQNGGLKNNLPAYFALAAAGIAIAGIFLFVGSISPKGALILCAGVGGSFALSLAAGYWEKVVLFVAVFFTSLNIKIHFFTFNEHLGGANGLRISAVFCLLIILYAKLLHDTNWKIAINWWITAPFMLYLAVALLSSAMAINTLLGVFQALQLFQAYLIFLYLSNRLRSEEDFYLVLYAIAIGIALQGGITVAQKYLSLKLNYRMLGGAEEAMVDMVAGEDIKRYTGLFKHPGYLGNYFVMYLPLTLGGILINKNVWIRSALAASAGLGLAALALTFSRAAMIGMGMALTLITIMLVYTQIVHWATTLRFILFELLLAAGILIWKGQDIYLRFTQSELGPVAVRFELADIATSMFKDFPLLGVGLNNFTNLVQDYERLTRYVAEFRHPVHNIYLLEFAETGFIGGGLFVFFLLGIFITAYKSLGHTSALKKYLAIATTCSIFGFLVISISDWSYRLPEMNTIFFTDLGLLGALYLTSTPRPLRPTI
jgi:O-antigen ligase